MSGFKRATISISQDEYDRLREAEQQLRSLPETTGEKQEQIAQESAMFLETTFLEMEHRHSALQNMLVGMADYVRDLEQSTNEAMLSFKANSITEMENYAGSLWHYFDDLISNHTQVFEEIIANNHHQYQEELGSLARQIRRMANSQEQKMSIAEGWLASADQLALYIRENYPHQHLAPGKLDRLQQQLIQARQNLDYGLSEAAIAVTQQIYLAISDLRVELEKLQTEWQICYAAIREAVELEIGLVEQSRFVQAVDLDGIPLDYLVNVEYWTHGRLGQIMETLFQIRERLADTQLVPDANTLSHWLTVDLPACHQSLEDVVLDARIAAINSQLRINIADLVLRALRDQGFTLSNAEYEANDMRLGYDMQLTNLEGNEVIVQVSPTGEYIGDNELQISSLDSEQRTEHELIQRWMEISRSLSIYGLEIGPYASTGATMPDRLTSSHPNLLSHVPANRSQRNRMTG